MYDCVLLRMDYIRYCITFIMYYTLISVFESVKKINLSINLVGIDIILDPIWEYLTL